MAEITFRDLKNMRAFKELPILTLDQRWYQLMPEHKKTDEVRYWERRVNELLKKQGRVLEDIKDVENTITELNQKIRQYMMILKTGNSFSMAGNAVTLSYIS